jgi:hypothetical protein
MPIADDAKQTVQRFSRYIQEFVDLFKKSKLDDSSGVRGFWKVVSAPDFRRESNKIWAKVAEQEGGKLTLTTVAAIIGAALGSIGVAGLGTAVGIPLIFLLPPVGYFLGTEADSWGLVRKVRAYLAGASDPTSDSQQAVAEVEQLTELVATLLARCEEAEVNLQATGVRIAETERKISDLQSSVSQFRARCEQAETAAHQAGEHASALGKRIADLEGIASTWQSEHANVRRRLLRSIWIGSALAIVTAILIAWLFVKR